MAPSPAPKINSARILLGSVKAAIDAGVEGAKISSVIDMALSAPAGQQAAGFAMCANALDDAAKARVVT